MTLVPTRLRLLLLINLEVQHRRCLEIGIFYSDELSDELGILEKKNR